MKLIYLMTIKIIKNYTWNYIEIDGELYLVDVSMASDLKKSLS